MGETPIGTVVHFFHKPMVAAVRIEEGELSVGDAVHIKGRTTDLHHRVDSMQIEHDPVDTAKSGDLVGVRVSERVREHDRVFRIVESPP
jgi:putative protease